MVPIGSLVQVKESFGPDRVTHYNGYSRPISTARRSRRSVRVRARRSSPNSRSRSCPPDLSLEWTDLTYQKIIAGNTAIFIYPLCILLVFMVLAAQYESLRLPLAIILIVPLCLLFALIGVHLTGGDNNIFTQIGFIVLIGLACKKRHPHRRVREGEERSRTFSARGRARGLPSAAAADPNDLDCLHRRRLPARHLDRRRSRDAPRHGHAVFAGMIGVTVFGLLLTPLFYYLVMKIGRKKKEVPAVETAAGADPVESHA